MRLVLYLLPELLVLLEEILYSLFESLRSFLLLKLLFLHLLLKHFLFLLVLLEANIFQRPEPRQLELFLLDLFLGSFNLVLPFYLL